MMYGSTILHLNKLNKILNVTKKCSKLNSFNVLSARFFTSKSGTSYKNTIKLSLIGVGVGAIVGTGYSLQKLNDTNTHMVSEDSIVPLITNALQIEPSRKIVIPNDSTGLKLTLYQYQTCPFCCKVRAFLDYYGISYDIVEVDPVLRQSVQWSQYKKVPILLVKTGNGYQQLNDSTMIISTLSSFLSDNQKNLQDLVKCYPIHKYKHEDGTLKSEIMNKYFLMLDGAFNIKNTEKYSEERKWRKWADDVLVHILSPNVYRSREEALQAFNWFSEVGEWDKNFPTWERLLIIYVGAFAMWLIGKKLKSRYHLKDDVRQSLYDECDYWARSINSKGTQFMGGSEPDLSDLAVYGILSSIEGCYAFKDLLQNSSISLWYNSMKSAVKNHEGMKQL